MAGSATFEVERRRHIKAPPAAILERIVDLHRWESWSPWEDLDPDMERTYGGADAGPGAWYAWSGNRKAGAGRMEIIEVTGDKVTIDLRFIKPAKSESTTSFTLEPDGNATLVTWRLTGPKTFMLRVMGLFTSMDKIIGSDFDKGLDRLKAEAEADAGGVAPSG